jgi:hypothetical protein
MKPTIHVHLLPRLSVWSFILRSPKHQMSNPSTLINS